MEVDDKLLRHGIWQIQPGDAVVHEPILVRAWMEYTVQHIITIMRDEDVLEVRRATVEWSQGAPVVTSNIVSSLPLGTITDIADQWREDVGA